MSNDLRFAFTLDPAEQVRASQLLSQRSLTGRLSRYSTVPFLVLPFVAAFVLRWPREILWPFAILLLVGIGTIIFSSAIQRWRAARTLAQYPHLRELTYQITSNGVRLSTSVTEVRIAWAMISEAIETNDLFVLFAGPKLAYYIPKRIAVGSADELRRVLHSSLGSRAAAVRPVPAG